MQILGFTPYFPQQISIRNQWNLQRLVKKRFLQGSLKNAVFLKGSEHFHSFCDAKIMSMTPTVTVTVCSLCADVTFQMWRCICPKTLCQKATVCPKLQPIQSVPLVKTKDITSALLVRGHFFPAIITYVTLDPPTFQIEQRQESQSINVQEILMDMRRYRMGLIQTPDQLRFSYLAIIEGARRVLSPDSGYSEYDGEKVGTLHSGICISKVGTWAVVVHLVPE